MSYRLRTLRPAALALCLAWAPAAPADTVDVLATELDAAMDGLSAQPEPPYYVAVSVDRQQSLRITAIDGALSESARMDRRYLDVDMRVGSPELDSTHPLRGLGSFRATGRSPIILPVTDEPAYALRQILWRELSDRYRAESEAVQVVRSDRSVLVAEEDPAPDFELRTPEVADQPPTPFVVDDAQWEVLLAEVARRVAAHEGVASSSASLTALTETTTFVDTEGARLVHGTTHLRVMVTASALAPDGDDVDATRYLDVHTGEALPSREALLSWADEVGDKVEALLAAPRGEPYSGPVMLRGRAAGVFFHEVLGHRVEGQRQKRDDEGKTFARYVGKPILPAFVDVWDDPTLATLAGADLNGHYAFDDEGVRAQRAEIVDDGVFQGFLMSRSPLATFPHSNGHGRRQIGRPPVSRMGNLVVEAHTSLTDAQMRDALLQQIRSQGLPFGLIVDEIQGGFTLTGRVMPNAFNVRASTSWRVWADGRPDELVRGIDLVGTPLTAFGNLVAAGGTMEVFNGYCGAESGMVPVSAAAPSVLFSRLEMQLKEKGADRPPLLPRPLPAPGGSAAADPPPALPEGDPTARRARIQEVRHGA